MPNNRIAAVNGVGYTYDAAGNLTYDGGHTYQYDGEGRIAAVDTTGAIYSYDSANRRMKKVVGSGASAVTTYYIWEGAQVIAEYSNAPAGGGGTSYYLADRLSTRMITDANGAFKGTQDHLPFGEDAGTSGTPEKHRFTNYERDTESGSDYAINRQHQSSTGRFMRPDPVGSSIGNPQSLNRYTYAFADPVNLVDRLGLCTINVALNPNNLLTAAQQTAMQDEIRRIYGDAGHQVSFVSSPSNADYSLTVNARSVDFNQPPGIAGITYRTGNLVSNSGRVFIDAINGSAGTATGYAQNTNNLGIGLGRAATHEMGHYLLQQAYDSMQIQGVMHARFYGEQWFGLGTRNLWTFNTAQRLQLASKICITPQKTTLNDAPIQNRLIGEGVGGGAGIVGYPGWFFALFDFIDWLESIGEGTVTSSYELMPPDEAP